MRGRERLVHICMQSPVTLSGVMHGTVNGICGIVNTRCYIVHTLLYVLSVMIRTSLHK